MSQQSTRVPRHQVADREFHNIRELLEMLMSELSPTKGSISMRPNLGWAPPTDVYETETEIVTTVDIAGMDRNKITVLTDGQVLTIRGVRSEIAPPCKKQFHKLEIQVGPFQRQIQIPVSVDAKNVSTNYSNGLLEVRLKKTFDKPSKRSIEVE
jgi:HSP20 family molecular chaperone IbpA